MNLSKTIKEHQRPFLVAGPCSAETEEQVNETLARLVKAVNVQLLRAGIWKPRTRPNSFEGIGEEGLPWLVNAAKLHKLPCAVEVANAKHVDVALKAGVDVLWIGARTSVNPFSVQEIADAVKGTDVPIMIKNPINPDLGLWIGAFERFLNVGITDLTAIHRGFSSYNHPKYRNIPNWEFPIALKEALPEIPLLCDPSHIGGKRALIGEISQKAMDLNADGLMIESHCNPDQAWSDAAQQLTPEALKEVMRELVLRKKETEEAIQEQLNEWRDKISLLDDRIFELLSERMALSEQVGEFKRENNVTILQEEHWRAIIAKRLAQAEHLSLSQDLVRKMMDSIHQESIRKQMHVMNRGKK